MSAPTISWPLVVGFAVAIVAAWLALAVRRSRRCDDGKPHEWQAWIDADGWEYDWWMDRCYAQDRECLNCHAKQRRWYS